MPTSSVSQPEHTYSFPAVGKDYPSAAERCTDASCIQRVSELKTEHLNIAFDLLSYSSGCICLQTTQALNLKNPRLQKCRAHDALRATCCGGEPSSPVRIKKATHSPVASILTSPRLPDGHATTGDDHVPCKDGTCPRAAASLNRCLYPCPNPKCLSPKPETLNPETESGTSGAGPGPGPLCTPPATHPNKLVELCVGKPHRQL